MATALTDDIKKIIDRFTNFVRNHADLFKDLHKTEEFPHGLWEKMGAEGLLGVGISEEYGGLGGSGLAISAAGHALVKEGDNMGIALSWLIHQLVSHYIIERFGTVDQREKYLPDLAKGNITACLAVSEPKTGPHPKHIKTMAEEGKNHYTLNGQKTYLTNGPIADIFVVIAVTGVKSGRKQFTAFIVPKEADGIEVFGPMDIPFFRPSPHGELVLTNCIVPKSSVLGAKDSAYDDIVLLFREIEDAIMMGPVTGALEKQSYLLSEMIAKNKIVLDEFLKMELGKLKAMLDTAKFISYESALMVDSDKPHPDKTPLYLFFRSLAKEYHVQVEIIIRNAKLKKHGLLEIITNDLAASAGLMGHLVKSKQMKLGESLVSDIEVTRK